MHYTKRRIADRTIRHKIMFQLTHCCLQRLGPKCPVDGPIIVALFHIAGEAKRLLSIINKNNNNIIQIQINNV